MDSAPRHPADQLDRVLKSLQETRKYRFVSPSLVQAIASDELAKGRTLKETIKETKSKLHQSAAVYIRQNLDYDHALQRLREAVSTNQSEDGACAHENRHSARPLLRRFMAAHTSTFERLPCLDRFYQEIFGRLPPICSVLDIACGLHPLARPWMPLPPDRPYFAFDIFADQIDFLNRYFRVMGYEGEAVQCNVLEEMHAPAADLAFLLKTLPSLEQIEAGAGRRLLHAIDAPLLVVSFPNHSLAGRKKGMAQHYAAFFDDITAGSGWQVESLTYPSEEVYIVRK